MTSRKPRSPQEFIEHASRLVRAGQERELLAFADEFGEEFLGRFTAEDLNRLEGIFESAQMIVDLEEWQASQGRKDGAAQEQRPATAGEALPTSGR